MKEHLGVPLGEKHPEGRAFRSVAAAEKRRQATRLQSLTQEQKRIRAGNHEFKRIASGSAGLNLDDYSTTIKAGLITLRTKL